MPKLLYRSKLPRPDAPDILEPIAAHLRLGVPLRYAATLAGISEHTAYGWVTDYARATEQAPPGTPLEELGPAAAFGQMVKEARAALVLEGVTEWRNAGKDWPKWATLLERLFPHDFGRMNRADETAGPTTQVLIVTPDTAGALASYQAQRLLMSPTEATE